MMDFLKFKTRDIVPQAKRRLKSIYVFKNKIIGGMPRFMYRRVDLEKDEFPYPDRKYSKVVGLTPEYVGQLTGKTLNSSKTMHKTLVKFIRKPKYQQLNKLYNKELINYRSVVSPGFNTGYEQFENYLKDPVIERDTRSILKVLSKGNFAFFRIPTFSLPQKEDIYNTVGFNPSASPGHYTSKLVANKRKGSIQTTALVAEGLYDIIKVRPMKNWYLWEMLGKPKDNKVVEGADFNSRIIMNTEEPMVLLLSVFAQRFTLGIQQDKHNQIFIGKTQSGSDAEIIENKRDKYDWTVPSDWIKFDSNIQKSDLLAAGAILLSNLDMTKGVMRRFGYLILSSLITKYVVTPPGLVIRLDKGLPSGHPFTSLINSVVNLIWWSLIGYEIYGKYYSQYMDIRVQGDDANVYLTEHPNLDRIDEIIKNLGIQSEPIIGTFIYNKSINEVNDSPVFLKRCHLNNQLMWNRSSVLRKLIYPSVTHKPNEYNVEVLRNYMLTAPDDNLMNELLLEMSEDMMVADGIDPINVEYEIEKLKSDIKCNQENNNYTDELMDSFEFTSSVLNKVEMLNLKYQNKFYEEIDKRKYVINITLAFPTNVIKNYRKQLYDHLHSRNQQFLTTVLGAYVPP